MYRDSNNLEMKIKSKDTKSIIIFVKNKPNCKVKRIFRSKTSSIKICQLLSRDSNFMEIPKKHLWPRKVISLPSCNSNNNDYMLVKNNMRMNKSCDKILPRKCLQVRKDIKINGEKYKRFNYSYHYNSLFHTNYKIYRCQISTNEESCCCSCNSDAMFEVMKSLYDCYKKKNCDNCNCILCGHLPREKRRIEEKGQSELSLKSDKKEKKKKKINTKKAEKKPETQEKPLPEDKTNLSKTKYNESVTTRTVEPIKSKPFSKKEKNLHEQTTVQLPLPERHSNSKKSLIEKAKSVTPPLSEIHMPSEKLKKTNVADLLTPLETKTPEQKEKILKELVMNGNPLPEAHTTSENKIMDKIRKDVGLPPKPVTSNEKEKYKKALANGFITPLEGKTTSQKEKIIRKQAAMGLRLPKGRTSSEKALIAKVTAEILTTHKSPEKIRKLDKKSAKLMKEGKGSSDECICSLLTPHTEKLPEEFSAPVHVSSEKNKKTEEAGYLTPLKDKRKTQKEKLLKGLAIQGIPLPDGKTSSENELLDSVRTSLGLPPEPKTALGKQKYKEATIAGVITPLEGKTVKQKEKILHEQAALGLSLPEGRTRSEKSLIANVKSVAQPVADIPISSKKLKKAKDAGLLTPIKGKTRDQKEKILKGLAMHGIPLPEVRTSSEKKIVDKIRADLGLPPPPVTSSAKEKYQKAYSTGLITPLEGKSNSQKEKVLQSLANIGLSLPEGRTPSEKALIEKFKANTKPSSELLTPLQGKTPEQKENILKGLAMNGIPLPEAKSQSEKKIVEKVRADIGLAPEPKTELEKKMYKKFISTGDIAPLEGKSSIQKEKILRNLAKMGLTLPSGRTSSEKSLITKIKDTTVPVSKVMLPSEKLRKSKTSGQMTPLEGKSREQKEKILKGLAMNGIPLPEATTTSEKKIIDKIRRDVGMPPVPKSPSAKEKYNKALASGLITPLEGKTTSQKEKVLRKQAALGLNLPEGRTKSEKDLIEQIKLTTPHMSKTHIPSQVLKKAKTAGLLTPLGGKEKKQKENILKGLAMNGIPLPEAKSPSENQIKEKVRADIGLPPEPKSPGEKKKYNKAIISGMIGPLEGKSPSQKENILRNEVQMGLALPKGRTSSERALIAKVTVETPKTPKIYEKIRKLDKRSAKVMKEDKGLSDECICSLLTPSTTKGREKSAEGIHISPEKLKKAKGRTQPLVGKLLEPTASAKQSKIKSKSKAKIIESFQDVSKITTCDKGCGCDKKKIKFKHSYVKIKITSPDISSLCPCPDECVPGVKGGVFMDNEGIKVTVGRATEIPGFSSKELVENQKQHMTTFNTVNLMYKENNILGSNFMLRSEDDLIPKKLCDLDTIFAKSFSEISLHDYKNTDLKMNNKVNSMTADTIVNSFTHIKSARSSSLDSRFSIETELSLSSRTPSTRSSLSLTVDNKLYESNHNFNDLIQDKNIKKIKYEYLLHKNSCDSVCVLSDIYLRGDKSSVTTINCLLSETMLRPLNHDIYPLNTTHSEMKEKQWASFGSLTIEGSIHPNIKMNEVEKLLNQIIAKELIVPSSSFIILIPTSSEDISRHSLNNLSSICIQVSNKNCTHQCPIQDKLYDKPQRNPPEIKSSTKNNISSEELLTVACTRKYSQTPYQKRPNMIDSKYQTCGHEEDRTRIISTDTTQDRPCCCEEAVKQQTQKYCYKKASFSPVLETPLNIYSNRAAYNDNCHIETSDPKCETLNDTCKYKLLKKKEKVKQTSIACGTSNENSNIKDRPNKGSTKSEKYPPCCCRTFDVNDSKAYAGKIETSCMCPDKEHDSKCCQCEKPRKSKNKTTCECPEELCEDLNQVEMFDDKYWKQIQSELTQTTSGFKVNVSPKMNCDMSFEDVLKYYAQEIKDNEKYSNKTRAGKEKWHSSKNHACECPEPETSQKEPFNGIKIRVDGKGSGSKGLGGILCFELSEYTNNGHQYRTD